MEYFKPLAAYYVPQFLLHYMTHNQNRACQPLAMQRLFIQQLQLECHCHYWQCIRKQSKPKAISFYRQREKADDNSNI